MKQSLLGLSLLFLFFNQAVFALGQEPGPFSNNDERLIVLWLAHTYADSTTNFEKGCDSGISRAEADSKLRAFLNEQYPGEHDKRNWVLESFTAYVEQGIANYQKNPAVKNCLRANSVGEKRLTRANQQARGRLSHLAPETKTGTAADISESTLPAGRFAGEIPAVDCTGRHGGSSRGLPKTYAMADAYASRCLDNDSRYFRDEMTALQEKYAANQEVKRATRRFNDLYRNAELNAKRLDCAQLKQFVFSPEGEPLADRARGDFVCWAEKKVAKGQRAEEKAKLQQEAAEKHAALPLSVRKAQYEKESEEYRKLCESSGLYVQYHDCDCLTKQFVEYRLQNGPERPLRSVFQDLYSMQWKQCIDQESARRKLESDCQQMMVMFVTMKQVAQSDVGNVCNCYSQGVLADAMQSNSKQDLFTDINRMRKFTTPHLTGCTQKYRINR